MQAGAQDFLFAVTDIRAYNPFVPSHDAVAAFLDRLSTALATDRVQITWKALDELAALGWSHQDALAQLALLQPEDLLRTEPSRSPDFGTIWVFCPLAWEADQFLWIRLTERGDANLLISFHFARGDPWT